MNIKNYTSTVPMGNSMNRIEQRLVQLGAIHIAKSYEDKKPSGIIFQLPINAIPATYKVTIDLRSVEKNLVKARTKPPTNSQMEAIREQAERTAWKLLSDWIDVLTSLIILGLTDPAEVFLPYLLDVNTDQTLYERVKSGEMKLIN
jgi:hypothetical protein